MSGFERAFWLVPSTPCFLLFSLFHCSEYSLVPPPEPEPSPKRSSWFDKGKRSIRSVSCFIHLAQKWRRGRFWSLLTSECSKICFVPSQGWYRAYLKATPWDATDRGGLSLEKGASLVGRSGVRNDRFNPSLVALDMCSLFNYSIE